MSNKFTPGVKSNLRLFMNRLILKQNYADYNDTSIDDDIVYGNICDCVPSKTNPTNQGMNNSSQTKNTRASRILTGTLGGKITYGNFNKPVQINYLGEWEGQPGGTHRPLRNKF